MFEMFQITLAVKKKNIDIQVTATGLELRTT